MIYDQDDTQTAPIPDDVAALADQHLRQVLMHYGQPASVEPPPDLAVPMLARLPDMPPAAAAAALRRRQRSILTISSLLLAGLLGVCVLGGWGIFMDSAAPAQLFGDPAAGVSSVVLLLILIAKPVVHTLLASGILVGIGWVVVFLSTAWLWMRLAQQVPGSGPSQPSGVQL